MIVILANAGIQKLYHFLRLDPGPGLKLAGACFFAPG